ncbi:hypothetical protein QFZ79_000911 [Arthrobacter sp. V4I6]|uniref:hypothetical protein n=1 Tax=unclassified Arthrobacter TaxID=235627 RepID=UPI0027855745|nr:MULTISPECIES: hypothetical protein [unclassified Arthrobacter]MDQ0823169.1 hypothetical protein [Arthrobacter sp. V1I7]MDQ0852800.1 hypothetical protein [Arthrobacter sp. V4I6]
MNSQNISHWILAGLWALPVSGLITAWTTIEPQPDQDRDPVAWARFVSSDSYQLSHLFGSTGGTVLAIFGVFALGCCLANSRVGRLALAAMVLTAAGSALLLVPAAISTFATPAIGKAFLEGNEEVMKLEFPAAMTVTFLLGLLLAFLGNLLLGIAVWHSHTLPRWAGAVWAAGAVLFYVLGVVLGQATTGSSLPTQTAGALLAAVAGGWIAWTGTRPDRGALDRAAAGTGSGGRAPGPGPVSG